MLDWIQDNQTAVVWLTALTILSWVGSLVLVPIIVVRIPADYFAHRKRSVAPTLWADRHPALRVGLRVVRNVAGAVLVLVGLALLVLPGQGILTVLLGLLMLDIPGKYRVERWLISRPKVLRAVNWLRRRASRPPLRVRPAPRAAA